MSQKYKLYESNKKKVMTQKKVIYMSQNK